MKNLAFNTGLVILFLTGVVLLFDQVNVFSVGYCIVGMVLVFASSFFWGCSRHELARC